MLLGCKFFTLRRCKVERCGGMYVRKSCLLIDPIYHTMRVTNTSFNVTNTSKGKILKNCDPSCVSDRNLDSRDASASKKMIWSTHVHMKIFYWEFWESDIGSGLVAQQGSLKDEILLEPAVTNRQYIVIRDFSQTLSPRRRKGNGRESPRNRARLQIRASLRCFSPPERNSSVLATKSSPGFCNNDPLQYEAPLKSGHFYAVSQYCHICHNIVTFSCCMPQNDNHLPQGALVL